MVRNSRDFHFLALSLCQDRRIIALDYRGRGNSGYDDNWRNYNPYVYLLDIQHVLNALNVQRAIFYGVSMGGLLTMALGAMAATRVAGAVIIDIGPEISGNGLSRIADYIGKDVSLVDYDEALQRLRQTWQENPRWSNDDWRHMARGTFQKGADDRLHVSWDIAIAKTLASPDSDDRDMWAFFRTLSRIPVLLVRGAQSDILSTETFLRMQEENPHAVGLELDGVGHTPVPHDPEILDALKPLLAECDSTKDHPRF